MTETVELSVMVLVKASLVLTSKLEENMCVAAMTLTADHPRLLICSKRSWGDLSATVFIRNMHKKHKGVRDRFTQLNVRPV